MWYNFPDCRQSWGYQACRTVISLFPSLSFYVLVMKKKKERSRVLQQQAKVVRDTVRQREQTENACELQASPLTAETADSCKKANPVLNGFNL